MIPQEWGEEMEDIRDEWIITNRWFKSQIKGFMQNDILQAIQ